MSGTDWMFVPTSLTMKSGHGTVMIEVPGTGGDLHQHFEELIIPVLLGAGFDRAAIEEYLRGDA